MCCYSNEILFVRLRFLNSICSLKSRYSTLAYWGERLEIRNSWVNLFQIKLKWAGIFTRRKYIDFDSEKSLQNALNYYYRSMPIQFIANNHFFSICCYFGKRVYLTLLFRIANHHSLASIAGKFPSKVIETQIFFCSWAF